METHSSVLAWRIPGTGEPGGMPSLGQEDPLEKEMQPTPLVCLGNPMDRGAWEVTVHEFPESDTT